MKTRLVSDLSEDEIIRQFFEPITPGLDDDVARVVLSGDRELLVSTDALQEDIHFLRRCPARLVGEKAVRVNASDVVASGGHPRWITLSLCLPADLDLSWLRDFADGIRDGLEHTEMALIGGDTTRSVQHISISVTAFGTVERGASIYRSGARVGDVLAVTGNVGEAILGLDVILGKRQMERTQAHAWIMRHFLPPFRRDFAIAAASRVTSMMDLSDGLAIDLPRLSAAAGVQAEVDLGWLPLSEEARQAGLAAEQAYAAGEDYELLFTVPPESFPDMERIGENLGVKVTRIGRILDGTGVRLLNGGKLASPTLHTWKHFS